MHKAKIENVDHKIICMLLIQKLPSPLSNGEFINECGLDRPLKDLFLLVYNELSKLLDCLDSIFNAFLPNPNIKPTVTINVKIIIIIKP